MAPVKENEHVEVPELKKKKLPGIKSLSAKLNSLTATVERLSAENAELRRKFEHFSTEFNENSDTTKKLVKTYKMVKSTTEGLKTSNEQLGSTTEALNSQLEQLIGTNEAMRSLHEKQNEVIEVLQKNGTESDELKSSVQLLESKMALINEKVAMIKRKSDQIDEIAATMKYFKDKNIAMCARTELLYGVLKESELKSKKEIEAVNDKIEECRTGVGSFDSETKEKFRELKCEIDYLRDAANSAFEVLRSTVEGLNEKICPSQDTVANVEKMTAELDSLKADIGENDFSIGSWTEINESRINDSRFSEASLK